MNRTLPLFGSLAFSLLLAACSAGSGGGAFTGGAGGGGSSGVNDGAGGPGGGGNNGGTGGLFNSGPGGPGSGGGNGNECFSGGDEDKDGDGFSVNQNDCNDCDPNVNPGSIEVIAEPDENGMVPEPADEDCDGTPDNVPEPCDANVQLADQDPWNGARAIDLCQFTTPGTGKWGVLEAKYTRADGSTGVPPYPEQFGILDNFGPNVNVQRGSKMLALSSGHARLSSQAGSCGTLSCYANYGGIAPPGFPQDVPACPGSTEINDDVALDVKIRAPKNATGYSFNFKFYSFEYPEWVCTSFNDQYISLVSPAPAGSINGNISFDKQNNPVSVNVAFFDVCAGCALGPGEMQGTGFDQWDDAGGTGWLKTQAPVQGGQEFTIRFAIWDTGDQAWDSTAVIDNFQWVANGGTVAVGTEPIPDPK